jgi:hypothetical protein
MIVAASKMDAVDDPMRVDTLERHVRDRGLPFFRISAVAGTGPRRAARGDVAPDCRGA